MGAPDPFKKREQSQEPTREELINFLTSSHYVRAVTIEAAKKFIDSKYGQVPWVSHMLGRLKFEYVQDSSFLGVFDPEKNALLIPEHSLYFDEKSLDPKLKKEYKGLAFGNVAEYSTALLLAIYHSVVKSRQKVESPETKKKILGALDHELGHAILHQIKNGLSDFGVSYAEIENYTIGRMRGKTDILSGIARRYLFVGGATISSIRVMQTLAKVFFGTVPDPQKIHEKGKEISDQIMRDTSVEVVDCGLFKKGDEPPTLEDLEKIGYSRQAAAKLKEIGGKNVLDLDRKYGFKVTSKYVDKEYGTRWEVSYSPVREQMVDRYKISMEEFQQIKDISTEILQRDALVGECFSRLLDALTDCSFADDKKALRPGIKSKDLEFFSRFVFEGDPMFDKFIEDARKKMIGVKPKKVN